MDASSISPYKRYVFLDKQIADIIDQLPPDMLKEFLDVLALNEDCQCGCRGRNHIPERLSDAVDRIRNYANIRWIAGEERG